MLKNREVSEYKLMPLSYLQICVRVKAVFLSCSISYLIKMRLYELEISDACHLHSLQNYSFRDHFYSSLHSFSLSRHIIVRCIRAFLKNLHSHIFGVYLGVYIDSCNPNYKRGTV